MKKLTRILLALGLVAATSHLAVAFPAPTKTAVVRVDLLDKDDGMHALVRLGSPTRATIDGKLTLTVNGVSVRADFVATSSKLAIDTNLGVRSGATTACVTFDGAVMADPYTGQEAHDSACTSRVGLGGGIPVRRLPGSLPAAGR